MLATIAASPDFPIWFSFAFTVVVFGALCGINLIPAIITAVACKKWMPNLSGCLAAIALTIAICAAAIASIAIWVGTDASFMQSILCGVALTVALTLASCWLIKNIAR